CLNLSRSKNYDIVKNIMGMPVPIYGLFLKRSTGKINTLQYLPLYTIITISPFLNLSVKLLKSASAILFINLPKIKIVV
ncbi:MAG: hypothetical protein AAFS12_14030, partial [Cyanobacteria bacterium J06632_19]